MRPTAAKSSLVAFILSILVASCAAVLEIDQRDVLGDQTVLSLKGIESSFGGHALCSDNLMDSTNGYQNFAMGAVGSQEGNGIVILLRGTLLQLGFRVVDALPDVVFKLTFSHSETNSEEVITSAPRSIDSTNGAHATATFAPVYFQSGLGGFDKVTVEAVDGRTTRFCMNDLTMAGLVGRRLPVYKPTKAPTPETTPAPTACPTSKSKGKSKSKESSKSKGKESSKSKGKETSKSKGKPIYKYESGKPIIYEDELVEPLWKPESSKSKGKGKSKGPLCTPKSGGKGKSGSKESSKSKGKSEKESSKSKGTNGSKKTGSSKESGYKGTSLFYPSPSSPGIRGAGGSPSTPESKADISGDMFSATTTLNLNIPSTSPSEQPTAV